MTTEASFRDRQIAVLIDYENVGLSSIQWLFDQVSDVGRIIVKRAYADWSVAGNKRDQLLELGIEAIHLFHSGSSGKNASDIRLAIDAVELMYQSPVDTFVIVSSDSDFVALVSKMRAAGKMVIGAGRRAATSTTLVRSCDRYHYLDQAEPHVAPGAPAPKGKPGESLLVRGVQASIDEQGKVTGSKLHRTLQRLDPSFDFRGQGYSTFTRYLEASGQVKVHRPGARGDVVVELTENRRGTDESPFDPASWGPGIDGAWSKRVGKPGESIPGNTAAADARQALGVARLEASPYKSLQHLLDASDLLRARWMRRGNAIVRR